MPTGGAPGGSATSSTTYATVQDYIAPLNATTHWVDYDAATNTATISSLAGFVQSQKNASKDVGAFDGIDRGQTENAVMGLGTSGLHFSQVSKHVIAANEATYATYSDWTSDDASAQYTSDFAKTDSVGTTVTDRQDMYNPMHYLSSFYQGYKTATVAKSWRIRTGIMQGDTANTTEIDLAPALQNYGVSNLDFATVWGQGHTQAERTGDATTNVISWVQSTATTT